MFEHRYLWAVWNGEMDRREFIKHTAALTAMTMTLHELEGMAAALPYSERMPVLFVGHGSPMNAIEENEFVRGFRAMAKGLPAPRAILCISAHWYIKGTKVTAMPMPRTIYDFGGFPQALYEVKYPAKGDPLLALETATLLGPEPVGMDQKWGLDHGAWTVLRHFFPKADVPVVQLSLDRTHGAEWHYGLAQRLAPLRDKGILIVGSGNIIHNLGLVDFGNIGTIGYGYEWALEAHEKLHDLIVKGDHRSLCDYGKLGRAVQLAVPTPDHYLPLIYALALKHPGEGLKFVNDVLLAGSLSMTSLRIG